MILVFAALLLAANGAPTPEQVASDAVGAPVRVTKLNISGRYAVVQFEPIPAQGGGSVNRVLLERFAFGWQAVNFAYYRCDFTDRGIDATTLRALLVDIDPTPASSTYNCADVRDYGDPLTVNAARSAMAQDKMGVIPLVVIAGPYAVTQWETTCCSGMAAYGNYRGPWLRLLSGGGALDSQVLIDYGVPPRVATCLAPSDGHVRSPECSSISHEANPAEAATIVVTGYYDLWRQKRFREMYSMLSTNYRVAHPYEVWLAQHVGTTDLLMTKVRAVSPTLVSFQLLAFDRVVKNGQTLETKANFAGTWGLVREGNQLLLDTAALHQTK